MTGRASFLVLGSNSFSGASFVAHLVRQGIPAVGVSRSAEPDPAFTPYRWTSGSDLFRFHRLDLNHDVAAIAALIDAERITHVVNFAAQSMVAESWAHPDHWFMTNVVSTIRLHDLLRRMDFLQSYVHVTTPEVYGNTTGPVTEAAPFNPSTPYAVSRAAADMSLRTFFTHYGFPVRFTRAANVFGPGQQLYRIIPRTILSIRGQRRLQLHGGGASERSFIHIDDVSRATHLIAVDGQPGATYHISTDRIITIRQLVEMICHRMGASFTDHVEIVGERPGKDTTYRLDSSKLRTDLAWADQCTLESGIDATIAWVDRNLAHFQSISWDYHHKA
jgi:dTDP-glucose 4,6-dehydratase